MLSYQEWRKLNESLVGAPLTLGLKTKSKVGELKPLWGEQGDMGMGGGMPPMGGDMGMEDMPMPKKKRRRPMDDEDLGDEDMDMDDEDLGDELGDEEEDLGDELGDEEEDLGDEEEDLGDEEEDLGDEEEDLGDEEEDLGDEEMDMMKKKKKPMPMGDMGSPGMGGDMGMGSPRFMKKEAAQVKKMGGGYQKKSKKMKSEQNEFLDSLRRQTGSAKFAMDEDGDWIPVREDSLIPPSDPNENLGDNEPGPGQVGYAPVGRLGELPSFEEWSSKYTNKKRKR